jgi:diguanylate cyclase (GGDEF)-like protein
VIATILPSSSVRRMRRPSLRRELASGRPPIAWALSLLLVFKGTIALGISAFPISPLEPTHTVAVIGVTGILAGMVIWLIGPRMPLIAFEAFAAMASVTASWTVAHAATHGGMMITAFAYPWVAIYSAHFFPRRAVIFQGALISVGFGVGLAAGSLDHVIVYWVTVVATIWSICLVMGYLSETLRRQADTDPLTGLLNRAGFLVAANREHAIAQRTGNPLTVAVLDLDGFKQINDLQGHAVGDRLLADLGRSWGERLRAGDILARHGGDEFVLLLPATSPEGAVAVLDRLHDDRLPVTWSVGIGTWFPGEGLDECIARADTHLYSVKNALRLRDARGAVAPLLGTA